MKIAILCKKDGNPETTLGIVKDNGDEWPDVLATWDSFEEAKEFAEDNILCKISEVIFIDLDDIIILEP